MSSSHHKILGIPLENLNNISKNELVKAFHIKLGEIVKEEKELSDAGGDLKPIEDKKNKLQEAILHLSDDKKRAQYIEDQQKIPQITIATSSKLNSVYVSDPKANHEEILKEHANFYKDHPDKEKFKSKTQTFNSFNEFKKSDAYKNMPEEDQKKCTKDNYPKKVIILYFDNWQDALKFIKDMEQKGLMAKGSEQKLTEQLQQRGLMKDKGNENQDDNRSEITSGRRP